MVFFVDVLLRDRQRRVEAYWLPRRVNVVVDCVLPKTINCIIKKNLHAGFDFVEQTAVLFRIWHEKTVFQMLSSRVVPVDQLSNW